MTHDLDDANLADRCPQCGNDIQPYRDNPLAWHCRPCRRIWSET